MNIIFHHPLPLDNDAKSASGIRPLRMLAAFESLGCQVDLVVGYAAERRICISRIKNNVKKGKKYSFVYSESSTMPTVLTEPHHMPLHPFLDWFFLRFCNKENIPVGLFYRDVYWLFENYGKNLNPIKAVVAKAAYRFDLKVYSQTISKVYLPSKQMSKYVPYVNSDTFEALPPGHLSPEAYFYEPNNVPHRPLKLFYVGGMSSHYQLHQLVEAVCELPQVDLTLCTRESEWMAVKAQYPKLSSNIRVIHKNGKDMELELQLTDIAVLYVKPQEYWKFASPVKLYEYLGFTKPILASEGTLAGKFVRDNDIGWTIPYEKKSVKVLLATIAADRVLFLDKITNLKKVAPQHSWQARAQQVIEGLT